MGRFYVAAVNFKAINGKPVENLERIKTIVGQINAEKRCRFILFPELCLSGYPLEKEDLNFYTTANVRKIKENLKIIAKESGSTLLCGLPLPKRGGGHYIGHIAVSPNGILGVHKKAFLGPSESSVFDSGDEQNVFNEEGLCFGMQLCYEVHFPIVSQKQALKGAEVLFVSFASPGESTQQKEARFLRFLPARAYDNSCFLVCCNLLFEGRKKGDSAGMAMALNPKGEVISKLSSYKEGYVLAEIDTAEVSRIKNTKMGYFLGSLK